MYTIYKSKFLIDCILSTLANNILILFCYHTLCFEIYVRNTIQ